MAEPRSASQRKQDTIARLENDVDVWVASADAEGNPYLVPLSYLWDGTTLTLATPWNAPTGRNLRANGQVRLALGPTRDVVLIEGTVEVFDRDEVPVDVAEAFAAKLWDARKSKPRFGYFRVTPLRVRAWREENELSGRELMTDGSWLV